MKSLNTDVVVVGAGAAGLLAAIVARRAGREVVVVESTGQVGGSTATDTGHVWLPGNHWSARLGREDTAESALTYLDAILGAPTDASSADRRAALVRTGRALSRWLEANGVPLAPVKGVPDFHQGAPGAARNGRVVASGSFDRRALGAWAETLRTSEYGLEIAPRSARGLASAALAVAQRVLNPTKDLATGGTALVARLLQKATGLGALIWLDSPVTGLLGDTGRVTGVRVTREGQEVELLANDAVILASGGFEADQALREEYLPLPTDATWTTGCDGNTGVPMMAAHALGARLAGMTDAWWNLVSLFDGTAYRMTVERSLPFSLIVDQAGDRFVNEAGPMPEIGRHFYERHRGVRAIPSYLVVDNRHRQHYRLGPWLPGSSPRRDDEALVRAETLNDLATRLGVDRAGLIGTVVRFNGFAEKGRDLDFKRGESAQDRAHGDPTRRKNPCLGPVEKGPFWAVRVYPGDAGTKGGLLVDDAARVLADSGDPIPGLYAVGGTAASVFKQTAPGKGAGLGAALVEAFRAVLDATGQLGTVDLA